MIFDYRTPRHQTQGHPILIVIPTAQVAATRLIHGASSRPALLCPPRISFASPTPPNPLASGSDVGLELAEVDEVDEVTVVVLSAWVSVDDVDEGTSDVTDIVS